MVTATVHHAVLHTHQGSWDKHEARRARLFPLYRRRGFLMFDQSILQLNSLLDAINSYAARYRIELASVDREPDSKKNRANNVWFEVRARDERETPIARL